MPTDEASIEKLDGTVIQRTDIVEQMISYYREQYEQELTDICDLNTGSEMRTLIESIAVEIYDLYYQDYELSKQKFVKYATGQFLDLLGCEVHLTRKQSTCAEGQVTFSISEVYGATISIPSGTILLHRNTGYAYLLKTGVNIPAGQKSAIGEITSQITGQRYNAEPNTITAFANTSIIRSDLKVTNNNSITGGSDAESDEDFRERILNAKRERAYGTITSYSALCTDIDGVHDVQFVNPENVEHYRYDDSIVSENDEDKWVRCTDCTRVLYVNGNSKPCGDSVLAEVEYQMTLQSNLVIGHEFHVEKADCADIYFYVSLYLEDGVDSVSQRDVVDAIQAYMDGGTIEKDADNSRTYKGLNIRQSVEKRKIIEAIEYVPGVDQVDHVMRMRYNTDIPIELSKWTRDTVSTSEVSASYSYIDDKGYTYKRNYDKDTIDYWGLLEFSTIDLRSGRVAMFASMASKDGYSSDTEDHLIELKIIT